jgi:hypothetical protein
VDIAVIGALGLSFAVALASWRAGLLLVLLTGFVQDPWRKLIEGEPVYLTGLVGGVFAIVAIAMALRRVLPRLETVQGWRRTLRRPVMVFVGVVAVQALLAFGRSGNIWFALLGLAGYLAPLPAALVGYHFAGNERGVRTFLVWYVTLVLATSAGIYLSFAGFDWTTLRQVGPGLLVFSQGTLLEVHTGFWRSPEIAAWHAGTAVCFLMVLGTLERRPGVKTLIAGFVIYLVGAVLLTGRRKMLVEAVVFITLYAGLFAYMRHSARRLAVLVVLVGLTGAFALDFLEPSDTRLGPYLRHGTSGFLDAPGRVEMLGLGSVRWAINRHGLFGVGAGIGSQGAQHFGGGASAVGGAAEAGLGRIVTELGLPGLLVIIWLVLSLGRLTWSSIGRGPSASRSRLEYGLAAFVAANALTFLVASQVFGDIFVLLILGWTVGLLLGCLHQERRGVVFRTFSAAGSGLTGWASCHWRHQLTHPTARDRTAEHDAPATGEQRA